MLVGREANKATLGNVALVWAPAACSPQTSLANSRLGPAQILLTACFWACTGSSVVLTRGASAALLPRLRHFFGKSQTATEGRVGSAQSSENSASCLKARTNEELLPKGPSIYYRAHVSHRLTTADMC